MILEFPVSYCHFARGIMQVYLLYFCGLVKAMFLDQETTDFVCFLQILKLVWMKLLRYNLLHSLERFTWVDRHPQRML